MKCQALCGTSGEDKVQVVLALVEKTDMTPIVLQTETLLQILNLYPEEMGTVKRSY